MGKRLRVLKLFASYRKKDMGMSVTVYRIQMLKYLWCALKYPKQKESWIHPETFVYMKMELVADQMQLSTDKTDPVLIVVVKDDLERIKMIFRHYRKLGIHQFIVLDNQSSDQTKEYCMGQKGTRVYSINEEYTTERKEAWVERVICMTGLQRWYIIVDSDELLDCFESEQYPVQNLIRNAEHKGVRKIKGLLLDMYSDQAIFSLKGEAEDIELDYPFFDGEGYEEYKVRGGIDRVYFGGPRKRVYGTKDHMSKYPIIYYDEMTLLFTAHICLRIGEQRDSPLWCVLRHYKFLHSDLKRYTKRVVRKNFGNHSMYYSKILDSYWKNQERSFICEISVRYVTSSSLQCLPIEEWRKE